MPNGDVEVTDQHLVVSGVPRGATYNFRLRAKNASGTSAWSETLSNHTGNALPIILPLRSFQEAPSRNVLGQYDAVFSWLVGGGAALHEVRVREVGTEAWSVLPSDPDVAGEGPRVIFTRATYDSANFGNSTHVWRCCRFDSGNGVRTAGTWRQRGFGDALDRWRCQFHHARSASGGERDSSVGAGRSSRRGQFHPSVP